MLAKKPKMLKLLNLVHCYIKVDYAQELTVELEFLTVLLEYLNLT